MLTSTTHSIPLWVNLIQRQRQQGFDQCHIYKYIYLIASFNVMYTHVFYCVIEKKNTSIKSHMLDLQYVMDWPIFRGFN
jgi:hypothetical protein